MLTSWWVLLLLIFCLHWVGRPQHVTCLPVPLTAPRTPEVNRHLALCHVEQILSPSLFRSASFRFLPEQFNAWLSKQRCWLNFGRRIAEPANAAAFKDLEWRPVQCSFSFPCPDPASCCSVPCCDLVIQQPSWLDIFQRHNLCSNWNEKCLKLFLVTVGKRVKSLNLID